MKYTSGEGMRGQEITMNVYAEFLGWWLGDNNEKLFPLFNIRGEHERAGSTVTDKTLISLGIQVPAYK